MARDLNLQPLQCQCRGNGLALVGGRFEWCLCPAGRREAGIGTFNSFIGRSANQVNSELNDALAKLVKGD